MFTKVRYFLAVAEDKLACLLFIQLNENILVCNGLHARFIDFYY